MTTNIRIVFFIILVFANQWLNPTTYEEGYKHKLFFFETEL